VGTRQSSWLNKKPKKVAQDIRQEAEHQRKKVCITTTTDASEQK